MKIEGENSEILNVLRFPMCCGVVLVHAYSATANFATYKIAAESGLIYNFVQEFFSQVLGQITVPLFFVFSGLLLFRGKELTWPLVKSKWHSRFYSIVLPLVIWNSIVILVQVLGQSFHRTQTFFSGSTFDVNHFSFYSLADAFIGFHSGPTYYPLWFLRDLFILTLISPVLQKVLKTTKGYFLIFLFLAWLGFFIDYDFFPLIQEWSILFFSVGLYLASSNTEYWENRLKGKKTSLWIALIYLSLALTETAMRLRGWNTFVFHEFNIVIGIAASYSLGYWIIKNRKLKRVLYVLAPLSYFVFLGHGIPLLVLKKLSYKAVQPSGDMALISMYFGIPIATVLSLIAVYFFFNAKCKFLLRILTGKI